MQTAMGRASYFNFEVIKETYELNTTPREGVEIERKLPLLLSPDSIFESTELI